MSDMPIVPGTAGASDDATENVSVDHTPIEHAASDAVSPDTPVAEPTSEPSVEVSPAPEVTVSAEEAATVSSATPEMAAASSDSTPAVDPASIPVGGKLDLSKPTIVGTVSQDEFAKAQEAAKLQREAERERKEQERKLREEVFAELSGVKERNETIEVSIVERVKGGLRAEYKGVRVFLPSSHFGNTKHATEEQLAAAIGTTAKVKIHELQSDESGIKSAVVSRREVLQDEFWSTIEQGAEYDGVVTSIMPFGVFVDIGIAEGLVHISRLSKTRITTPEEVAKRGMKLRVTVSEVDREKKRLSLSHREHESDPWVGVDQLFPVGTVVKGVVRRMTDFGAYVQVASRIQGLVRISDISWSLRLKHPSDVFTVGQEINVAVLELNPAKHQLTLGYKQAQPNPWSTAESQIAIGTRLTGTVQQSTAQGLLIRVVDTFDGFMPRSKMAFQHGGKKADYNVGDSIDCIVVDLNPVASSLILATVNEDGTPFTMADARRQGAEGDGGENRGGRRGDRGRRGHGDRNRSEDGEDYSAYEGGSANAAGVTLADLLRDKDKTNLNG
ncbi:MAG: S1 RNA-binding domain-containing protein [Bradyrhizobiaceae bacterium]|nr:S1 RNA-binding domain-containing protein [Bradyrhizobiaceae bacterium]